MFLILHQYNVPFKQIIVNFDHVLCIKSSESGGTMFTLSDPNDFLHAQESIDEIFSVLPGPSK